MALFVAFHFCRIDSVHRLVLVINSFDENINGAVIVNYVMISGVDLFKILPISFI